MDVIYTLCGAVIFIVCIVLLFSFKVTNVTKLLLGCAGGAALLALVATLLYNVAQQRTQINTSQTVERAQVQGEIGNLMDQLRVAEQNAVPPQSLGDKDQLVIVVWGGAMNRINDAVELYNGANPDVGKQEIIKMTELVLSLPQNDKYIDLIIAIMSGLRTFKKMADEEFVSISDRIDCCREMKDAAIHHINDIAYVNQKMSPEERFEVLRKYGIEQ